MVFEDSRVERKLVRLFRLDEAAGPEPPVIVKMLERESPGVTTCVGGVVVGSVRHERPVQKLSSRVVAEGVVVEDVQHRKISDGQDQATPIDAAGKLVGIRLHFFATAAEAPGLAREQPGPIETGARAGGARDLSVCESAESGQRGKRHALRDLGVEIKLASPPGPCAEGRGRGERIALLAIRGKAVGAGIRRTERVFSL